MISYIELLGYVGMIITLYSFTKDGLELRKWNMVGAAIMTLYCLFINNIPIALLNYFLMLIDAWKLEVSDD